MLVILAPFYSFWKARVAFDLSLNAISHSFAITKEATELGLFIIGGEDLHNFLGSLWLLIGNFIAFGMCKHRITSIIHKVAKKVDNLG